MMNNYIWKIYTRVHPLNFEAEMEMVRISEVPLAHLREEILMEELPINRRTSLLILEIQEAEEIGKT